MGHDVAFKNTVDDFVLVSNCDLVFHKDSITKVVKFAIADASEIASWELRQCPYEHPKYYDPVSLQTSWSSHACILIRRSTYIDVGGYEPLIFMYGEDVELSYRFRNKGYKLRYLPQASIIQDMGIYPIAFVTQILGIPSKISAAGKLDSPHSEAMASAVLEFDSGARAVVTVSGHSHVPTRASVSGTEGVLLLDSPFFTPSGLGLREAVFNGAGPNWRDESAVKGHEGLCYLANYLASYVSQGLLESPLHTHAEAVAIIGIGEEIRRQIGVQLY
jgi:hypothetical protein